MKLTSLDLELNKPSGKIVQIGAVIGDTLTGEITHRLNIYVNPNEQVSDYIQQLCGISQKDVDNGFSLNDAYVLLKDFHRKYSDFMNPLTWGGDDGRELKEQLDDDAKKNWCFGERCIDAKTICVTHMIHTKNKIVKSSLSQSMKRFGLSFSGREHNALDDAENTFKIYHHMLYLLRHKEF